MMRSYVVLIAACFLTFLYETDASILGSLISAAKPSVQTTGSVRPEPLSHAITPTEEFVRITKDAVEFAAGASHEEARPSLQGHEGTTSRSVTEPEPEPKAIAQDRKAARQTSTNAGEDEGPPKGSSILPSEAAGVVLPSSDAQSARGNDEVDTDDTDDKDISLATNDDLESSSRSEAGVTPLSDQESTDMTGKALRDMGRELGPMAEHTETDPDVSALALVPTSHRNSLMMGIESTLTNLARVYDHLVQVKKRKSDEVAPMDSRSESNRMAEPDANSEGGLSEDGTGPMESGIEALLAKQREIESPVSTNSTVEPEGNPLNVSETGRSAAEIGKPAIKETPAATAVLSILAGLVVVAAIGLMVVGFVYSHRDSPWRDGAHAPLYPPRGPDFV